MEDFLVQHGLPALFVLSFLAATVLPIGSEWLLVALVLQSEPIGPIITVATVGNYLGACTTYLIGFYGSDFFMKKVLRTDALHVKRARSLYKKYGSWSLLFSWLPIVGDPLCLVGGALRLHFLAFSALVFIGKLSRYVFVAIIALQF